MVFFNGDRAMAAAKKLTENQKALEATILELVKAGRDVARIGQPVVVQNAVQRLRDRGEIVWDSDSSSFILNPLRSK